MVLDSIKMFILQSQKYLGSLEIFELPPILPSLGRFNRIRFKDSEAAVHLKVDVTLAWENAFTSDRYPWGFPLQITKAAIEPSLPIAVS